ncbi:MAG: PAS domain S-box protein, partial [Desulfatiglandales bacterium]
KVKAFDMSEGYYKVMVEESFDGIFIQKGTKIWLANRRLHEMLGYTPYELLGKEHWIVYTPEYQALTRERAQRRMRGEDVPARYNVKLQKRDGSWIYGEINAKAVEVEGEKGVLVWIKDVHEQLLTKKALEESESKFRSAFEQAGIGVAIVDPNGVIMDCNEFFARFLSYKREELIGVYVGKITYQEDWITDTERHRALLSGVEKNIVYDKRYVTKDDKIVWGRLSSSLVVDEKGNPRYFISHIQDISKEKLALDALKEKDAFISAILSALPDPIIVYDKERRPIYTNPAFESTFGWKREDLLRDPTIYLPKGGYTETDAQLIELLLSKREPYMETNRVTRDGRPLKVLVSVASMGVEHFKGYILTAKDISSFVETRQRLENLQRLESLGLLAGGIAHDFNNLLTVIMGRTSMLKLYEGLSPQLLSYIEDIEKSVKEASNLTRQLLSYARGEELRITELDILRVLEDTISMFGSTKKGINLYKLLDPNTSRVNGDRTQISQVLMNLLINAADAVEVGGEIFVESSNVYLDNRYVEPYGVEPGTYVQIIVRDTGVGISEEVQRRIFDPFFSTKELGRGTGMGLATVYSIIKSHKGIINCISRVGEGTTFEIYLPALESSPVE